MTKFPLLLLGCQSPRSSSAIPIGAHREIPISNQYAELIAPDTYRVHHSFIMPEGETRNLGHFDISIGQTIRVPGTAEISLERVEVTALEAKNNQLHLHSTHYFINEPPTSNTSSIPIRE